MVLNCSKRWIYLNRIVSNLSFQSIATLLSRECTGKDVRIILYGCPCTHFSLSIDTSTEHGETMASSCDDRLAFTIVYLRWDDTPRYTS